MGWPEAVGCECETEGACGGPRTTQEASRSGREFFYFFRCNPLKSPNSTKGIQGNASFFLGFPWISLHETRPPVASVADRRRRLSREGARGRLVLGDERGEVDALGLAVDDPPWPATITRSARCAPQSASAAIGSCAPEKRGSSSVKSARSACSARRDRADVVASEAMRRALASPSGARRKGSPPRARSSGAGA